MWQPSRRSIWDLPKAETKVELPVRMLLGLEQATGQYTSNDVIDISECLPKNGEREHRVAPESLLG